VADTLGTVPQDVIGLLGGDWIKARRAENLQRIWQKFKERQKARNVDASQPASLSVALPLLIAAADESRDELQDIWARLLAAAADPSRTTRFRIAFIDAAKKMDPLDAAFFFNLQKRGGSAGATGRISMAEDLNVSHDEIDVSWEHLKKLELVTLNSQTPVLSAFGREFLRAVSE
jgi:uncharacterized protein YciU (UPF0263 family)